MIYVTDTHPLVFHLTGKRSKLGQRAALIFRDADRGRAAIVIPIAVLEEIMRLAEKGVVRLPWPFVPWVREISLSSNYLIQPYTVDVLLEAAALPQVKDPLRSPRRGHRPTVRLSADHPRPGHQGFKPGRGRLGVDAILEPSAEDTWGSSAFRGIQRQIP